MADRQLLLTCVFSLLLIAPAMAGGTDSGKTEFKEQTVLHKVTGNKSANATASFRNGIYTLNATVDGVKHEVRATSQRLKWNDKRLQIDGFQKIEIVIAADAVTIHVDGTQVLPDKPPASQKQSTPRKSVSPGKNADSRPNILFIIADDASRDSMGVFGSQYIKTPGFDAIAKKGVVFTQAYNCNPKCAPARACLLTGRYSWQLEEACNHNPTLSAKWSFYPYLLEDAGYFVGFTGKGWSPGTWAVTEADGTAAEKNPAGYAFNELKKRPPYKGIGPNDYAANFDAFLGAKPENTPFCFWLGTKEPHRGYGKDNGFGTGEAITPQCCLLPD